MPDLFKAYVNPKFGEPVATSYYRRPPKLNERVVMMGCYHFDLPLDVKKGIIRLVKYDLPIFQWVQ